MFVLFGFIPCRYGTTRVFTLTLWRTQNMFQFLIGTVQLMQAFVRLASAAMELFQFLIGMVQLDKMHEIDADDNHFISTDESFNSL